jgi:hypothetical protein
VSLIQRNEEKVEIKCENRISFETETSSKMEKFFTTTQEERKKVSWENQKT